MLAVENLVHAELATALGLAGDRIIYEHQSRDALGPSAGSRVFATITTLQRVSLGPATPVQTVRDNPTPSAGQEILIGQKQEIEWRVRITLYSGASSGDASSFALLSLGILKLALDDATARFDAGGVAFVEAGEVRHVPLVLETEFESRAIADLRFRFVEIVERPETYIETAEFAGTYNT